MTKVALYARYSSDKQSDTSIEDQLETRKNRVISGEAGWFDDVEASGRTKGIVRTNFHHARR
ncbi:recombinase family protein [Novosphingobium resinovorum]|uniref:recombinase family protein n=1 Tax=Novosphingobium resinovorum TaxID=158500 RepID=UPI002ECFFF93|nr:recombinase family protein [Novosphingobium resinovorum]